MSAATSSAPMRPRDEFAYHAFLERLQDRFSAVTHGVPALFTADVSGEELWRRYLAAIPAELRQHNTCHACRQFVERYGNIVTMATDGTLASPLWDPTLATPELRESVAALRSLVENARVSGPFLTSESRWGIPLTGEWRHLAVYPAPTHIYRKGQLLTAGQKAAELREDFRCLQTALSEFRPETLEQARTILEAEALTRSEKFLGVVTWLLERHEDRKVRDARLRHNRLWRAVAVAPAGFCKPRSGMIGTLLEDLISGMPFDDVQRRFNAKMHPLQYQRPQAPPAAGNIQQAEAAIEKLGLKASLERRFATLEDVQVWVWRPQPRRDETSGQGVFGHLVPKGQAPSAPLNLPEKTLTWVKFRDTVLPTAERIELMVPGHGAFCAFVTSVDPNAPPLLQWDREDRRNPVSWYFYVGQSYAEQWSLTAGAWVPVLGLTLKPNNWQEGFQHHGEGVLFVLEGARDRQNNALGLFPELLRSDLHGVRATLEAYSRSRTLVPVEGALASGLMPTRNGSGWSECRLRVTSRGNTACYRLDRWD